MGLLNGADGSLEALQEVQIELCNEAIESSDWFYWWMHREFFRSANGRDWHVITWW